MDAENFQYGDCYSCYRRPGSVLPRFRQIGRLGEISRRSRDRSPPPATLQPRVPYGGDPTSVLPCRTAVLDILNTTIFQETGLPSSREANRFRDIREPNRRGSHHGVHKDKGGFKHRL